MGRVDLEPLGPLRRASSSPWLMLSVQRGPAGRRWPAGERLVLGVGQRRPRAVEPVGQVGLVVAPAVAVLGLDDRQVLVQALEPVRVAGLEDVGLERQLRGSDQPPGKSASGVSLAPHAARRSVVKKR